MSGSASRQTLSPFSRKRSTSTARTDRAPLALIKGAGDLATGVALSLHAAGFRVLMTELARPTAIRLSVSFATAVYEGHHEVEGVRAELATASTWHRLVDSGTVAVRVDPEASCAMEAAPDVIVDAIMAKRNLGTLLIPASVVVALGPGFTAGTDADAVIETARGHALGRIISTGTASADTGVPGDIGGRSTERVLRAPVDGRVALVHHIGDLVRGGEVLMRVEGRDVAAPFDGCLRGAIRDRADVRRGMKIGDVDPRGNGDYVHAVSDKARAVGRAALEAALSIGKEKGILRVAAREAT